MNKDIKHIDNLLELYWNGESSLVQEEELRTYFNSNRVHQIHEDYTPLFEYFNVQSKVSTELDVEGILKNIEEAPAQATSDTKLFSLKRFRLGIAASLTLLLTVGTVINIQKKEKAHQKIVLNEDYETREALRITKDALALLSGNLDKSTRHIKHGVSKVKAASILK